jgi:hypothetical protein
MGDRRGAGDATVGAPLVDGEGMAAILMVMDSVKLGPGTYGPGDEWKFPSALDEVVEVEVVDGSTPEPAPVDRGGGLLHRLTHWG